MPAAATDINTISKSRSRTSYNAWRIRKVDCETTTAPTTLPEWRIGTALFNVRERCPAVCRAAAPYFPVKAARSSGGGPSAGALPAVGSAWPLLNRRRGAEAIRSRTCTSFAPTWYKNRRLRFAIGAAYSSPGVDSSRFIARAESPRSPPCVLKILTRDRPRLLHHSALLGLEETRFVDVEIKDPGDRHEEDQQVEGEEPQADPGRARAQKVFDPGDDSHSGSARKR